VWRRAAAAGIGAVLYVAAIGVSAQPWTSGRAVVPHLPADAELLASDVTIYRDRYGIPHVVAKSDEAMYFGFGYASAEDHLEKILTNYRLAAGRMAELAGQTYFLSDYHARLFRLRQMAVERASEIDPALRAVLDPFVRGINYFMERYPRRVPAWAEPVEPADVIGFHRYITLFEFVLARYGVFGPPAPLPTGTLLALSPTRTRERLPTLLVTCQADWDGPLTLYEAHLSSDDGTDVYGATFPGLPAIYVGCNQDIAWGFTPNAPDLADTYLLALQSMVPLRYAYMGASYAFWVEPTQVLVARPSSGPAQPVPKQLAYSHNGPVVRINNMIAEILCVAGWQDLNGLRQWLRVNRARSVGDFKAALSEMQVPSLNAVCVNKQGRIYYAYCARAPQKPDRVDWRSPVDGSRGELEWQGYLPFDKLPQITDPPAGFVQSANGLPWRATERARLRPTDYPRYLVEDTESLRSERLLEVMQTERALPLERVKRLAWDVVVPFASTAVQMLVAAHQTGWRGEEDLRGSLLHAVQMLERWDRRVATESSEAMLFETWWRHYRAMFPEVTDVEVVRALDRPGQHQSAAALRALRQTVDMLMARHGRLDVPWGKTHRMGDGRRDYPVGGSAVLHTLHQTGPRTRPGGRPGELAASGDVFKLALQLAASTRVYSIVPFGNATASTSRHTADQMETYANEQFKHVDLVGPACGRNVESAWGTSMRFELDDGSSVVELRAPSPVNARARAVSSADIEPPLPEDSPAVGQMVRLAVMPPSAKCTWTLTVKVPPELRSLRTEGFVPVAVVEAMPNRWRPLRAQWTDDGASVIVQGESQGLVAVHLVQKREMVPDS